MADQTIVDGGKKYYIYGAGDVAREVLYCLRGAPRNLKIEALIVSDACVDKGKNVDGIPVIPCDELKYGDGVRVIVAVLEKYRDEICDRLDSIGVKDPILMTFESDLWCEERGKAYALYRQRREKLPYVPLQDGISRVMTGNSGRRSFQVYVAKSHLDKTLREKPDDHEWEKDIQVGAALTQMRIADVIDCSGKHISEKNRQYCELTALYWIWKNAAAQSEYVGLCHYRRRFVLSGEDIDKLLCSRVDVVVTNPVANVPNVLAMYEKNHIPDDWKVMRDGIRKLCPEYLGSLEYLENSNYYIPYNMFIMQKDVLNAYCGWLFPILEYCEMRCGQKEDTYQNRYIGFLAERLMTVYLYQHRKRLQVVFSKKHFCE